MAEEVVTPAQPSAPTAVSSPLSSPSPAPSAPAAPAAPAVASTTTPSSPDGTTAPATRPDGIPDSYWDATANALKVDPVALAKDLAERDELKVRDAAQRVKESSRPQKPEDFKHDLPADFKAPSGSEFKFDKADPNLAALQKIAHEEGWTQQGYSRALGAYAAIKVAEDAAVAAGKAGEIAKLGPTAPARVDAVRQWLAGMDASADKGDAKALAGMLVTARHVEAFERIITRLTSQGGASFSTQHRVPADDKAIPGYENMSFEQRRFAQDQRAAQRRTA